MTNLLAHASQPDNEGMAVIKLEYNLSRLAEALLAAGHISKSREYATRPEADPFRLPRDLRQIALGKTGADFDDKAAFPSAKAALVRPCRGAVRAFLRDREHIMQSVGNYFLSDDLIRLRDGETDPQKIERIRRGNVKALFNSIDMDGSLEAWKRAQGVPSGSRPLSGLTVTLANGRNFCLRSYISEMEAGSLWLADHLPAMRAMTVQWLRATGDEKRLRHPERTLASYVFQEQEGIARDTKIAWANRGGHTVHNLQHDGIIIELNREVTKDTAAKEMSAWCSQALAFPLTVTAPP